MKKPFALLLAFLFSLAFVPLSAQEADVADKPEVAVEKPVAEGKVKKPVTKAFPVGEIVVKDQAAPNIEDASTTTIIPGLDIEQRGDKSLGDSLQMVPGVNVFQTAKGYQGFSMRGFDQKMVAILIDGIPVLDPYYGGNNTDISSIPVANVSHIVVNRGVASALYGALGSIGSINVVTKKPERTFQNVNFEYGHQNTYALNVDQGASIGDFYYWVAMSYQYSNGYEISKKLDKSERRKWFDRLVQYNLFTTGPDAYVGGFPGGLASVRNYINDNGTWNHTSYKRYQVNGRIGYSITDKIETGVSAYYYSNIQKSNTFSSTTTVSWNEEDAIWDVPDFTADGRSSAFQNRAFSWPEDTRLTVSPYLNAEFGNLSLRMNVFFISQRNNLEGWANQSETLMMFPPTAYPMGTYRNEWAQSIYEETSYGFFILPTYKFANWNKLAGTVHYRYEGHEKLEKAIGEIVVNDLRTLFGTGEYTSQDLGSQYVTLGLEDNMHFKSGAGDVFITAGISYDAQDITKLKVRSNQAATLNQMVDAFYADADTMLWGTRDSVNPVLSVIYDPLKDFLRLRAAGAMKTKFPSLDIYKDITDTTDLTIEPERIYATNAGFELFFLNNALSIRNDYFYTRIDNKIESLFLASTGDQTYTNIDGYVVQGLETTIQGKLERIAGIVDLSASAGYVFSYARNYDDSVVTKGEKVENLPVHQFIAQLILDFVSDTRLMVWGNYTQNQIRYVMAVDTTTTYTTAFTTKAYTTVRLYDPIMLNVRLSQKLLENFELYVMCKNILDEYNADPFNPGPGRMFYFGGGAKL